MALAFKKGDKVKQILVPIEGEVIGQQINDDEVVFHVEWTDAEGNQMSRWFKESELALQEN